jgi:hypothetical protein
MKYNLITEWMHYWVDGASSLLEDLSPCSRFCAADEAPIPKEIVIEVKRGKEYAKDNEYWGEHWVTDIDNGSNSSLVGMSPCPWST